MAKKLLLNLFDFDIFPVFIFIAVDDVSSVFLKLLCMCIKYVKFYWSTIYLHYNICNDHKERIEKIEEEPYFHWLDVWSEREGGGDREVDRGEHHHAGDVHCDDQVLAGVRGKVDHSLVDYVHQDCWQVCYKDNICRVSLHVKKYSDIIP